MDSGSRYYTCEGRALAQPTHGSKRCPSRKNPRKGYLEQEVKVEMRNHADGG